MPTSSPDDVSIVRVGPECLEQLRPVYETLHAHHATLAPSLASVPVRSAAESWRRRHRRYREWLAVPDSFLLLAHANGKLVGYALVSLAPGMQGWATGERLGEIHDIAVLPSHRRRGIGSLLLARARRELAARGVEELPA